MLLIHLALGTLSHWFFWCHCGFRSYLDCLYC